MHENRTDQVRCCPRSENRNPWSIPHVQDSYVRPAWHGCEGPLDLHPLRYTANVAKSDAGSRFVDGHFRKPPGRPIQFECRALQMERSERPMSRHLHQPSSIRALIAKPNVSVVCEMLWPIFYPFCERKHCLDWRANETFIDRHHRPSMRQRSELDGTSVLPHDQCTGIQLVVTRKPRRRCALGLSATASSTVSDSSPGVKPRNTETTPSWRLTA